MKPQNLFLFLGLLFISTPSSRADYEPWIKGTCAVDAQRLCRAEIESGGNILACMRSHAAEFDSKCKLPPEKRQWRRGTAPAEVPTMKNPAMKGPAESIPSK
jgi:hypothetical protein